jgi:hypothetical protein
MGKGLLASTMTAGARKLFETLWTWRVIEAAIDGVHTRCGFQTIVAFISYLPVSSRIRPVVAPTSVISDDLQLKNGFLENLKRQS